MVQQVVALVEDDEPHTRLFERGKGRLRRRMQHEEGVAVGDQVVADLLSIERATLVEHLIVAVAQVEDPRPGLLLVLGLGLVDEVVHPELHGFRVEPLVARLRHRDRLIGQRRQDARFLPGRAQFRFPTVEFEQLLGASHPLGLDGRVRTEDQSRLPHQIGPDVETEHGLSRAWRSHHEQAALAIVQFLFDDGGGSDLRRTQGSAKADGAKVVRPACHSGRTGREGFTLPPFATENSRTCVRKWPSQAVVRAR